MGTNSNLTIRNSKFDGSFEKVSTSDRNGGFVGFASRGSTTRILNCLFAPDHIDTGTFQCDTWVRTDVVFKEVTIENSYCTREYTSEAATDFAKLSASEQVGKLGSGNWQEVGGVAVPKMTVTDVITPLSDFEAYYVDGWTKEGNTINPTVTSEAYQGYATINDPNLKGLFYHKSTGTIDQTLLTQTRQSSVLLTWKTDNNPIDYFRVMRRVKGQGEDKWQEVATDLTDISYEDTSVSPLMTYEYKVQAVNDCEGITMTETQVKVGECKHTGRVEGYVRFNDGTGAPAVWVVINYNNKEVTRVQTDESGYFEVDGLSYQGGTTVDYSVGPVAESGISIPPMLVTFDAKSNNETLREFTIENGRRFSGYVMYEGTSIPVKGVNFLVDGNRIHNAQGRSRSACWTASIPSRP